jgi:hypothetical protein
MFFGAIIASPTVMIGTCWTYGITSLGIITPEELANIGLKPYPDL